MERRREPRHEAGDPARITVLAGEATMSAQVLNFSANGVALELPEALPAGTLIRVDWGDRVLLGEIVHCAPAEHGFVAGLRLEHAIYNTLGLAALSRELGESEPLPERQPHSV